MSDVGSFLQKKTPALSAANRNPKSKIRNQNGTDV